MLAKQESIPILNITPDYLDFGVFNPDLPLTEQPEMHLEVTNSGSGILIGRVIPQFSWLIVTPVEYRVGPGQVSSHLVTLSTGAPRGQARRGFSYNSLIVVSSNGGTKSLGGGYYSTQPADAPSILPAWSWFLLGAFVFLVFIFFLSKDMISGWAAKRVQDQRVEALYTQGAATEIARLTETRIPEGTATPEPPLFAPPVGASTPTPELTMTLTPWPRTKYNVEQFIKEYYATINSADYEHAWGMLSRNFQGSCCKIGGNEPFLVYSSWWKEVQKVEVVSAYLQAWDKNPATVYVRLHYLYKNGKTGDLFQEFTLISNEERKTLLIDMVK